MQAAVYLRGWCDSWPRALLFLGAFLSSLWSSAANGQMRHFKKHREFLGWSKDGRYALWYDPVLSGADGNADKYEDCIVHLASVLDTRRGSLTRYLMDSSIAKPQRDYYEEAMDRWNMRTPIECASPDPGSAGGGAEEAVAQRAQNAKFIEKYRKQYASVPKPAALRALLQGSPLQSTASRTSPDRSLRLELEITSKRPVPKRWDGDTLKVGDGGVGLDMHIFAAVAQFLVKRGEQGTASIFVPLPDDDLSQRLYTGFAPIWAPDGRHLALVLTSQYNIKRDIVEEATAIMPTLGPKIALESTSAQLAQAQVAIGDALHRAGHSLLSAEAVARNRLPPQTRVLAIAGYEAAAQAIAAVLPGGAAVGTQTTHTSYHLTIQLGGSVSLPPPSPGK